MQLVSLLKSLFTNKYFMLLISIVLVFTLIVYGYNTKTKQYYTAGYEQGVKDTEAVFTKKQLEIQVRQNTEKQAQEEIVNNLNKENSNLKEQIRLTEKDKNEKAQKLEKRLKQYENNKANNSLCYSPNDDGLHIIQDSLK